MTLLLRLWLGLGLWLGLWLWLWLRVPSGPGMVEVGQGVVEEGVYLERVE